MHSRLRPPVTRLAATGTLAALAAAAACQSWRNHAGNVWHAAVAPVASQPLERVRWSVRVDLVPPNAGGALLAHYGSPLATPGNTILVPVKTDSSGSFRVDARRGRSGRLLWRVATDYVLPPHRWTPMLGCAITPGNAVAIPAAGGTVLLRGSADSATGPLRRIAFYGLPRFRDNPASFTEHVRICTPITAAPDGSLYFGFRGTRGDPLQLESGIVRIPADGPAVRIAASDAAGDASIVRPLYNCAPALSRDGRLLYVAMTSRLDPGFGFGYLVALDSQTLAPRFRARLKDARNPDLDAWLPDDGTASPTVGPDGEVYFGVLENPFGSHNVRGWLLHFDRRLQTAKTPGSFGWDLSASVVPRAAVPSYTGSSAYLLLTKYNNYAGIGTGDGVNRMAVLDPHDSQRDAFSPVQVMREVLTIAAPTPDEDHRAAGFPDAVTEWCVNTAAVDPRRTCALVNNEDGVLYRWDFATNTLSQSLRLTPGILEAYTPTIVAPDGAVLAIQDARLFSVGAAPPAREETNARPTNRAPSSGGGRG